MEITLTRSNAPRKDARLVIYNIEGRTGSVQFLRTAFGETIPATLTITGEFAQPKVKETPEERKARLAAETPKQKFARAEARLEKMREKLAKDAGATTVGDYVRLGLMPDTNKAKTHKAKK